MAMTREVPLHQGQCALLVIDMQNYCAVAGRGLFSYVDPNHIPDQDRYIFDRLSKTVIPSIQKLQGAFRKKKAEIIYTYIESLTKDGRDQSLDYKISGFFVAKGSPDAQVIDQLAPAEDEIMIPKTSCSVFCSTNIEYVLRNLGITQIVMVGVITNQCVESAVRDAADKGFLVTLVEEGCAAHSQQDHDAALKNMKGFARFRTAAEIEEELRNFKL